MNDKKFTDEEIVKALRCCVEVRNCGECPVKDEPVSDCLRIACTNAANLIERQKAEIESTKAKIEICAEVINTALSEEILLAKAEAYKEFAERLKERKTQSTMDKRICTNEMIDNLLKEMVGEGE